MPRTRYLGIPLLASALAAGCFANSDSTVLAIDASGAVAGLLFLDRNGDGEFTPSTDTPARSISFAVVRGPRDTVATGTTDESGIGLVPVVPVGTYRLLVDPVQLGDSLWQPDDTARITIVRDDTSAVLVGLQYQSRTVREARNSPPGKLVAIEGVALNGWSTFGDSTVHVADSTGAIRLTGVQGSPVAAGNSVRVVGRTGVAVGDPVLANATVFVTGAADPPVPTLVATVVAASAHSSTLAAALVRIEQARVIDSRQLANGDVRLKVDDGSGMLELLLDRNAGISSENPVVPGAVVDATGVLVPLAAGRWQLKPRSTSDFEVTIPTVTIAAARAIPVGQIVTVEGVALNGWATFGDGTVHLSDSTASIRISQGATSFIAAGDSARFVGILTASGGQPLLSSLTAFNLGRATVEPEPVEVTSTVAATAMDGILDAALVQVAEVTVSEVRVVTSETHLVLDYGSGELTVVLDRDTDIAGSSITASDILDITGVLVSSGGGGWVLKPRQRSDLVRR
jgi:hypothetical protein